MDRKLAECFRRAWTRNEDILPRSLMGNDSWTSLWQVREHLVGRALAAARDRGRSYRDFHVGVAAFISSRKPKLLRSLGRTPQHIYTGANWKLGETARNTCGEQEVVAQIRQQVHIFYPKEVMALVVAGNALEEPDRESGIETAVLHPCNHCRHLLCEIPQMTRHTLIVSVNLDNTKREILHFEELLKIHGLTFPDRRSRA